MKKIKFDVVSAIICSLILIMVLITLPVITIDASTTEKKIEVGEKIDEMSINEALWYLAQVQTRPDVVLKDEFGQQVSTHN